MENLISIDTTRDMGMHLSLLKQVQEASHRCESYALNLMGKLITGIPKTGCSEGNASGKALDD